jgi:hypothetical protein
MRAKRAGQVNKQYKPQEHNMNKHYRIESLFFHKNLKCVVTFSNGGYRCGYVGISPEHPLFGIAYNTDIKSPELLQELKESTQGKRNIIDIFCWDGEQTTPSMLFDVHGGITYSEKGNRYPCLQVDPIWWFGFDCAHYDDGKDWPTRARYFVPKIPDYVYEIERQYLTDEIVRTKEYVIQECRNLAEQLDCVGELLKQTRLQIGA